MAERTEPIRQDIETTRASMTDKLEQIEGQVREKVDTTVSQAKRAVDVRQHVNERPWLAFGAAVVAGYFLGSMGGDERHEHHEPARPRRGEPMRYYAVDGNGGGDERHEARQAQHVAHRPNPEHDEGRHETRYYQAQSYEPRRFASRGRRGQMSGALSQIVDPLRSEVALIATAAVRSGMRALRESLRDSIPQFESEYQAAQRERGDHEEGFARAVGDTSEYSSGMAGTSNMGGTSSMGGTYGTGGPAGTSGIYDTGGPSGTRGTGSTTSTGGYNDDPFRPR